MLNWTFAQWMVLVGLSVLIVSVLTNLYTDYRKVGCLREYVIIAILIFLFFKIRSKGADDVHIHHYVICMVVLAFTGYQNAFATLVSGIANGIMIEGGSFWGWDPIFIHYPPKPPGPHIVPTPSKFQKSKSSEFIKNLQKKSLIKIENQEM
jgi:hypothetical protein